MLKLSCLFLLIFGFANEAWSACGGNTRSWQADAGTTNWNTNNNWNPRNRPNTANENALIVSDWFNPTWPGNNYTLGCLEILSGTMTATNNNRVTIVGDYFRNLNPNSLLFGAANTWEVRMQGTADQTFENVDLIPRLRINNANTVTLTHSFTIRNRFLVDAGTGAVVIEGNLTTLQTNAFTIQGGVSMTVAAGASWTLNGNLIIDGSLIMEPGSSLIMADGSTLTISAGGIFDINGTAGNAVQIATEGTSPRFTFNVVGTLDAQYLVLENIDSTGLNITGTITRLDNVSFNAIPSSGAAMTLGASATLPSALEEVGFFDDGSAGPFTNVNASAYNSSPVDFDDWSGIGDTANENDPNGVINWGTEASPVLQVQNLSVAGVPPATIAKGSASTHFATFSFSMSGTAPAATNITSLNLTLDGSNSNADISNIAVYNDTNGNCTYDGGTDTLIGNYTPSGTPGMATVSLSGEINVIDSTQDCLHVFLSSATAASTGNTIGISIESTDDVSNDQAYSLSETSGPPVRPGTATITGAAVRRWNGGYGSNMATNANWTPSGVPNSSIDCEIGNGYLPPNMSANYSCLNTRYQYSGTINWNNRSDIFNVYGTWRVENGFTYNNSNNAIVDLRGADNQSVFLDGTTFPNDVRVNSGGTVTFEDSGRISGNLVISSGDVEISANASLQVDGNITVASGASLSIQGGGELIFGNGSSLTINSGGSLSLVGSSSLDAQVRALNDASSYTITVNNGANISAQYYSLRNLGVTGLTISASSIIDGTNSLQNGSFSYPGANNSDLLRLFQQIPGDVLDGMSFDSDSSGATGVNSIYTSTGATADILSMTNYAGNMTGAGFTDDNQYLVSWDSETNELKVTQESTAPATADQGDVVNMGSFGFQQLNAGAFNDTNLTSIRITLTGTGSASDLDSATIYYDPTCSGSGGTLIGTQSFSGNPARAIFSGISGATIESHATTPPLRCINVTYNLDSLATSGKTIGAEISSSTHVVNSESFEFNGSFSPPINLGTTTIIGNTTQWTGAVSTDWFTAGNWNGGLPDATLNCIINNKANDPIIGAGTATCKSMNIGNGILTHSGGTLAIYGSLESTGTINSSSTISFVDNGVTPTSQNVDVTSPLSTVTFNKTAGGSVNVNSDLTLTSNLNMNGSQNFTLNLASNNTLTLNAGLTLSGGTFFMNGGSELQIASGQTLLVDGGTFQTSGTNDPYPQALSSKAHITNTGGTGTWSFSASSGSVDLVGFYFDWLDSNGLNFSGSVNLDNLSGGQLRNLPSTPSMRALQFNTTGSLPATASNFGWNWGPSNSPPLEATPYFLGFSTGCSSQTIDFDQWFGDFWPFTTSTTDDKIFETACNILIDPAKSPVSLTQLEAVPYDSKVVINWTTGSEWNHIGFNVYRSLKPNGSFTQINNETIQNDLFSTHIHGTYAFIDEAVQNGRTYYYFLEDISVNGQRTLHGPLSVIPDASFGDPPLIQAGTIISSSDQDDGGDENDSDDSSTQISENIWVLSQTPNFMRLKISIPNITFTDDPLNNAYKKIHIDGYSPTAEAGKPELLNKTIMIPVDKQFSDTYIDEIDLSTTTYNGINLSPSPEYRPSGDRLIAHWDINYSYYAMDQLLPDVFVELSTVVEIKGSYYLPLIVQAVRYNPSSKTLLKADEIQLSLNFSNEKPWENIETNITPWMREGTVKLGFLEEGMYQVTYDELYDAGVVSPIHNAPLSDIHLQISTVKMGIHIDSADDRFNSGDTLHFYAPQIDSDEDLRTYAALFADSTLPTSLSTEVNGDVQDFPLSDRPGFWTKKLYEENNIAVFNEPFTEETDHFVWQLIYGVSGGPKTPLDFDIELPYLSHQGNVSLRTIVKSRRSNSENTMHNLELYINDATEPAAETSFQAVESKSILFTLPSNLFSPGKNKIRLIASGDELVAGEYDMLYVDRVETYFHQNWATDSDEALLLSQAPQTAYQIDGFNDSNLLAFDVSSPGTLYQFNSLRIQPSDLGFAASFGINGDSPGRRVWLGTPNKFKSISSFELIPGSHWSHSSNGADIIYLGHKDLLQAVLPLGDLRISQGYKVEYVETKNLYNEFGNGLANVQAIKDFIQATKKWKTVPKYFVLLGDGTYDPKSFQTAKLRYRFPVKFISGSSFDYVSDHWFVSDEKGLPTSVIARIPAKEISELQIYVQKVIDYENGIRKPTSQSFLNMISDKPHYTGEDFEEPIEEIQALAEVKNLLNPKSHIKRVGLSDIELKEKISNSFSNSSLMHYMGHGAENIWADMSVFSNSDVQKLENESLPLVIAMNCLNAQYAFPEINSFAEELIFNPNGGAIAFWGSTSFTPPSIQEIYQKSFYKNMGQTEGQTLGELVKLTKVEAGLSSPYKEVLYSWTIIGDPLVKASLTFKPKDAPQETVAPSAPTPSPAQQGGGCSAIASYSGQKSGSPWHLFFGFMIEALLTLLVLRLISTYFVKSNCQSKD